MILHKQFPRPFKVSTLFAAVLTALLLAACGGSGDKKKTDDTDVGNPSGPSLTEPSVQLGGLLWDNLWAVKNTRSLTTNPAWALRKADPSTGTTNSRTGDDTWRCKECHGWDYKGVDGAYGEGSSHYTGFPNIWARIPNLDREAVRRYLKEGVMDITTGQPAHNFGTGEPQLTDVEIESLLLFIFNGGMVDTGDYIYEDAFSGSAKGRPSIGKSLYEAGNGGSSCGSSNCHGIDGKLIDFNAPATPPEYLGTLALENPWEVLHKARFGQPDAPQMVPVLAWGSNENAKDILAYTQSLPRN